MDAVRINTLVDNCVVTAIPALRPFLGHKVELIALDAEPQLEQQKKTSMSLDEFIATRPKWPANHPPITLEEMDQAIVQGALKSGGILY
jgi:hypothetical protein